MVLELFGRGMNGEGGPEGRVAVGLRAWNLT